MGCIESCQLQPSILQLCFQLLLRLLECCAVLRMLLLQLSMSLQ